MSRIIQPMVSPGGRVIVLSGATLWLVAAMLLSATPEGARATTNTLLPSSTLARTIELIPGAPGPLYMPRVFTDPRGGIYLTDKGTKQVVRIAGTADIRSDVVFGREGAGPGEFMLPREVAVDSDDNVFVLDSALQRILKFAADGTYIDYAVAVGARTLVIDSQDRLIVRPGRDGAMFDVYSTELEWQKGLLEQTDPVSNRSFYGVLTAIDAQGRMYLLDQSGDRPTMRIYDRDLSLLNEWPVDPPLLRESVAARLEALRARLAGMGRPTETARVDGILTMAVDPQGERLVIGYIVTPSPDLAYTRVAWYSPGGTVERVEDRDDTVFRQAFLADGTLLETTAESLRILVPGETASLASSEPADTAGSH